MLLNHNINLLPDCACAMNNSIQPFVRRNVTQVIMSTYNPSLIDIPSALDLIGLKLPALFKFISMSIPGWLDD